MKIIWDRNSTDWLHQFITNDIPEFNHFGGQTIYKIGAKFILSQGSDLWIADWTSITSGSAWSLTKVIDLPKLMNGGYKFWEFKYESWQKTGYYYRFNVDSRYIDSKSDFDKFPHRPGAQIIVDGKLNAVSSFYKVETHTMSRGYLPSVRICESREIEEKAIMDILNGTAPNLRTFKNEVLENPDTKKIILRELQLNSIGV
jgi:hypothetical protein